MQFTISTSVPLAASATFSTAWYQTNLDTPQVTVEALSDAGGLILLQESDGADSAVTLVGTATVSSSVRAFLQGSVRARLWRVVYTNGAAAQTTFALTVNGVDGSQVVTSERLLAQILQELRSNSVLLAALKEPSGMTPTIPFGPDAVTQQ